MPDGHTDPMTTAERALHHRTELACGAAAAAGVPGRFQVWERAELMAVLASAPELGFLSTISGVTPETVPAVLELLESPVWHGVRPTVVVAAGTDTSALPAAGLVRTDDRGLAIRRLGDTHAPVDVRAAGADFATLLLAGYEVDGPVAAFIEAETRLPGMRRFVAVARETPIAAAAMTIHDGVAVLGGASTLRAHRGAGAQSRLLRHRLLVATEAGCELAVATVTPDSVSARNLRRAGFAVHRREAWTRP